MNDTEASALLASSSWEQMAQRCEEHAKALEEYAAAGLYVYLCPGSYAEVRLMVAEVALARAERRMTV